MQYFHPFFKPSEGPKRDFLLERIPGLDTHSICPQSNGIICKYLDAPYAFKYEFPFLDL